MISPLSEFLILQLPFLLNLSIGLILAESSFWLSQLFGRLHPMMVHFPIALILAAVVMELFTLGNFRHSFRAGIRFLVIIGTISALFAALMGWFLAENVSLLRKALF